MPAQDRGWRDREELRPPAAAYQPRQRRKPDPVSMIPTQAAAELAAQHLVLMAQHEQLHVLGQVRANQHAQQTEQAPHQLVGERQQHPEIMPAALLITQQTPAHTTRPSFRAGHHPQPHPRSHEQNHEPWPRCFGPEWADLRVRNDLGFEPGQSQIIGRGIEDQITTLRPYNARYTGDNRSIFRKAIRRLSPVYFSDRRVCPDRCRRRPRPSRPRRSTGLARHCH